MLSVVIGLLITSLIIAAAKPGQFIWFPSPGSWIKAIGLAIPTWFGAVAVFSLEVWHGVFLFFLAVVAHAPSAALIFFLVYAAGFLAVSLIWYLLLILIYSLFLRFLWSELPRFLRWIKPPNKWRDVLFGWSASTLAVAIGAAPFLLLAFYSSDLIVETMRKRMDVSHEEVVSKMFGGWFVAAAYLYHVRGLIGARNSRLTKSDRRQSLS